MTTCFGYTRVSTVKQGEGVSLEAQKDAITKYADHNGLKITNWFEEKETAAKTGRPVFNQMMRDLKSGRAGGLIVHKIDRSARNFRDWALIGDLADSGVQIHFATETLDFGSRGGRLAADVQAVVAADYIRNLRDETIKGLQGRLKQGLYPYRAPLGYLDMGRGNPKKPDPKLRRGIVDAFELYGTGEYSFRSLQTELEARGYRTPSDRPISLSSLENILGNPFYAGIIRIKRTGETFPGVHETLITSDLFTRVQKVKANRSGKKVTKHAFTYRRLIRCAECGFTLSGERQKSRVYYRCHTSTCPVRGFREDRVEQIIHRYLKNCIWDESQKIAADKTLSVWYRQKDTLQRERTEADLQMDQLNAKLDRLTDAFIDRVIDRETMARRRQKYLLELKSLEAKKKELGKSGSDLRHLLRFFELLNDVAALYKIALAHEKRQLVELATSNVLASADSLTAEPSFWFRAAEAASAVPVGCHCRATFRTLRQWLKDEFGLEEEKDDGPSIKELTTRLSDIFDKYNGSQTNSTQQVSEET